MPLSAAAANPFQLAVSARVDAATLYHHRLYRVLLSPYTAFEGNLNLRCIIPIALHSAVAISLLLAPRPGVAHAQGAAQKSEEKPANKQAEKPPAVEATENPAQIELLETRIRFEDDGASRKEVHARVKINNELGAHQFARLNFDYNRAFESIDLPLVRITHASGGTADILPSAITDQPNPAVVNAPAYQDVRVKTVRILGLEPGDLLEYRVVTTTTHHPLAPDFSLEHSFDRTGVVSEESLELDFPSARKVELHLNNANPATCIEKCGEDVGGRTIYRWLSSNGSRPKNGNEPIPIAPDVEITSFPSWAAVSTRLADLVDLATAVSGGPVISREVIEKSGILTRQANTANGKIEAIYEYVSEKIRTIDLPIGSTGFRTRSDSEILTSRYATAEDKFKLFASLARPHGFRATAFLSATNDLTESGVPRPSGFGHLLIQVVRGLNSAWWLDPAMEVAPCGLVPSTFRGKRAFLLEKSPPNDHGIAYWETVPVDLPFSAAQKVDVDATLGADVTLSAKVRYTFRGDNELLLRIAFHHNPEEKWKDLAQLLSLSDGFRGQVTSVTASDPYATKKPFTVEYEISQPKFVDWSKKPVRIPAVLPLVGLPDPPAKSAPGLTASPIDLGTPLDVEAHFTLHLPSGTTATAPPGTSVQRDYATFSSSYSAQAATISASRHLHFLLREIPAARAADYYAFLRAVRNDETQDFTLERADTVSPKTDLAAPNKAAPPKQNPPKP